MSKAYIDLALFLREPMIKHAWMNYKHLTVYLRKSLHGVDGRVIQTWDIANVNSRQPGTGSFWELVKELHARSDRFVMIENVLTRRLANSLRKRGFHEFDPSNGSAKNHPPCFVLFDPGYTGGTVAAKDVIHAPSQINTTTN